MTGTHRFEARGASGGSALLPRTRREWWYCAGLTARSSRSREKSGPTACAARLETVGPGHLSRLSPRAILNPCGSARLICVVVSWNRPPADTACRRTGYEGGWSRTGRYESPAYVICLLAAGYSTSYSRGYPVFAEYGARITYSIGNICYQRYGGIRPVCRPPSSEYGRRLHGRRETRSEDSERRSFIAAVVPSAVSSGRSRGTRVGYR